MLFVSPSYKRAGKVKIREWLPDVILAVHEFEEAEYRENDGGELLIIPDGLRGNIAKVRNFILDELFKRDEFVVMMDDDTKEIVYFENMKRRTFESVEQFESFCLNGFIMCQEFGFKLWGLNLLDDPKAYREFTPLSTQAPILGPFSAHIRNPLRYDARIPLKEDYDMALQHLHKYRGILRFNKYAYSVDHIEGEGGCTSYRMRDREIEQGYTLVRKWGNKIVHYNPDKSINPKIKSPIGGI